MLLLHGSKEDGRLVFLYDFVGSFVSLFGLPAYLLSNTIARKEAQTRIEKLCARIGFNATSSANLVQVIEWRTMIN